VFDFCLQVVVILNIVGTVVVVSPIQMMLVLNFGTVSHTS
jgi:hypothetical protein